MPSTGWSQTPQPIAEHLLRVFAVLSSSLLHWPMMVVFATLILFAYRYRSNPAAHKRLILLATIAIFAAITAHKYFDSIFLLSVFLVVGKLRLVIQGKVHPATIWGVLLMIIVEQVPIPSGLSAGWHTFATWARNVAWSV